MGGDTDLRGFDIRSISPIAFFVQTATLPLVNPDDPCIANSGIPCHRSSEGSEQSEARNLERSGSCLSRDFPRWRYEIVGNLEYRIPIAGPVTLAPFVDTGLDMVLRPSQLQINQQQLSLLNNTPFGCASLDRNFNCVNTGSITTFSPNVNIVSGTNYQPRMSTGLELQVIMPIVNAPFRIYYAYNPLRLNEFGQHAEPNYERHVPSGRRGRYYLSARHTVLRPWPALKEPKKTFRFTVATTF